MQILINEQSVLDIVEILKEAKTFKDLNYAFGTNAEDNVLVLKAICELQQKTILELQTRIENLENIVLQGS